MKVKLDENLSADLKGTLADLGHSAHTVHEEDLVSEPDFVVAQAAKAENRLLLTMDRGLGDIRKYPPGTHPGIVVFRLSDLGIPSIEAALLRLSRQYDFQTLKGCIVIVEDARVRVRQP